MAIKSLWAILGLAIIGCGDGSIDVRESPPPPEFSNQLKSSYQITDNYQMTLKFLDDDGNPMTLFDKNHEKYMHMVVVSSDLESFAHVHPQLDSSGVFSINLNHHQYWNDLDNSDAVNAVSSDQSHFVFTEVKPKGDEIKQNRFSINGSTGSASLVPDDVGSTGWITKYFKGDSFKVELKSSLVREGVTKAWEITANVFTKENRRFVSINDRLENWLMMKAHAIIVSESGTQLALKKFWHLHFGGEDGHHAHKMDMSMGEPVVFRLKKNLPDSGRYKIWIQTKYQGEILTFPFVLSVN